MQLHRLFRIGRIALAFLWLGSTLSAAMVPPESENVRLEGRVEERPGGAVEMGFPGIVTRVVCDGTGLRLHGIASSDRVLFDLRVGEEGPWERIAFPEGAHVVDLYDNHAPEPRLVTLVRRTESWQGVFVLQGLEPIEGQLLPPPELPGRRLLFIGDSITAGAGSDARPGEDPEGFRDSNGRLAFGSVLGRRLDAQVHLVAYGGKGLVRDWQGLRSEVTAPEFYERSLPDDPATDWNHSAWVPDAVAIGLGTNDFNQGIPDQQDWVAAYVAFVEKIRRDAPDAPVFLLNSPMHEPGEPEMRREVLLHYLNHVVEELDDPRVQVVELDYYPGHPDHSHPLAHEHEAIADELEPRYRAALGW